MPRTVPSAECALMGALVQERQGRHDGAAGFLIVPLFDAAR
jgi:hypothetical protein